MVHAGMRDDTDLPRLIGDLIRLGTIESVDLEKRTCRVQIGGLVTGDVPWLAGRAGAFKIWSPPSVGEQVLFLSAEADTRAGIALPGLYSAANAPTVSAEQLLHLVAPDGAEIFYDSAEHRLQANLPAGGKAAIVAPGGIDLEGDVVVHGKLHVLEDVSVEGKVDADGDVKAGGDVRAGSISLKTHKHLGVQPGGGVTGLPQ